MTQLHPEAKHKLTALLGSVGPRTMIESCNWPDKIRETKRWAWTSPLHYINIPPGETQYSQPRDCPEKLCNTEAIKRYARELGNPHESKIKRRRAFNWVCHLVADLHQPLHAGYASDRGGNDFRITFEHHESNLHTFWDSTLIKKYADDWRTLVDLLDKDLRIQASSWTPSMVNDWTEKSHALVEQQIYKTGNKISNDYSLRSWVLLQQQITTGASNLALIINTLFQTKPEEGP